MYECSTLLYALAVLDQEEARGLMGRVVGRVCVCLKERRGKEKRRVGEEGKEGVDLETESALRQLHQTYVYLECLRGEMEGGKGGGSVTPTYTHTEIGTQTEDAALAVDDEDEVIVPGVTQGLLRVFGALIAEAWDTSSHLISQRIRTSAFQTDVQETAESLGLCVLAEARDGPFILDMVIPPRMEEEEKEKDGEIAGLGGGLGVNVNAVKAVAAGVLPIVVEVDGPSHYYINDPQTMTGTSRLKHRLLTSQRHRYAAVVSISLHEWAECGYNIKKKKAMLLRKISEAGVKSLKPYLFATNREGQRQCALLDGTHHFPYVLRKEDGGE
jgi:hypothetical protein